MRLYRFIEIYLYQHRKVNGLCLKHNDKGGNLQSGIAIFS